ncbi:hypothetical protein [Nonomuraea sp. 3-1Str]|uniref:hypothetical protein n=1 Tax=unclassified Nonomuraea TaxID=2593643 RepID=UPI0028569376|nr:hypothetical protein [Nonomuraea sp. 3-1Str]MDR8410969.1 hypothetical protein [Nonomuraea sp. 3-1Str]
MSNRVVARRLNDHVEIHHVDRPDVVLEVPRKDFADLIAAVTPLEAEVTESAA